MSVKPRRSTGSWGRSAKRPDAWYVLDTKATAEKVVRAAIVDLLAQLTRAMRRAMRPPRRHK